MAASMALRCCRGNKLLNIVNYGASKSVLSTKYLSTNNQSARNSGNQTHFGFESVQEDDKQRKVDEVFENVAETYDVMNDAMSAGVHRLWKDAFMERLGPTPGTSLIDVAGGTGDIAFRFMNYVNNQSRYHDEDDFDLNPSAYDGVSSHFEEPDPTPKPKTQVTVCDINQAMLNVGKKRAAQFYHNEGMSWVKGNAESLPFDDMSFDAYTIAFGIRNTTHIDKVLDEAYRVLRPGGRFLCLEFSRVNNSLLRTVYDQYSFQMIPVMGQLIAGDWKSYQYLVESIRKFPPQEEFAEMLRYAGFRRVHYENLTFGVAAIHSGFKL